MLAIQKLDPAKFVPGFGILCQYLYPNKDIAATPFGSMWCLIEPGQASAAHNHHEGEIFIIVQGNGVITVNDESSAVEPGDVIYLPPLSTHVLQNTSSSDILRFLSVYWEDMPLLQEQVIQQSASERAMLPERVLVTATPPTPNGDLHLGHLSGPYLGADIYTRYLRLRGVDVRYISGVDDHQSYVELKGQQVSLTPHQVADKFGDAMVQTLEAASIVPDLVARPRASRHHIPFVQHFFNTLYTNDKLVAKDVDQLYCPTCSMYLFEAHVVGRCPHCNAGAAGNACEDCGRPNDCIDLVDPRCRYCGGTPERRATRRLYFPLSQYHRELEEYYQHVSMNAHMRTLCDKMLADGLPDIAVTHYSSWGIPAPAPAFADQRLYVWFEMAPGYLAATQEALGGSPLGDDWRLFWNDASRTVQFFGFDNGYFHAVLFPALFMAYDPSIELASCFATNEFYRLDGAKFSTSRMHAIWGRPLLDMVPADIVRFYLSYDRPETEQTNFTRADFRSVVERELVAGWQGWLREMHQAVREEFGGKVPEAGAWSDDHRRFYQYLKWTTDEIAAAYQDVAFSPQRATRLLCELVRTARRFSSAERHLRDSGTQHAKRRTAVALEVLAAKTLALLSSPIMPTFAQTLWADLGYQAVSPVWEDTLSFVPSGQHVAETMVTAFPELDPALLERFA